MSSEVNDCGTQSHIDYNVDMRMALLIQSTLNQKNDWKRLEELTGIKSVRWRHFNSGVIKPSIDMLEALFRLYPQHAFWLATGLTDYEAGHTAPQVNLAFPGGLDGEQSSLPEFQEATVVYFKQCLTALDTCWKAWIDYVSQRSKTETDRNAAVSLYKQGINTSLQLKATEFTNALGRRRQMSLIGQLANARGNHLGALISRLRDTYSDADAIIDRQRGFEAELVAEFEQEQRDISSNSKNNEP